MAQIPETPEFFAIKEQVVTELSTLNKFKSARPDGIHKMIVPRLAELLALSVTQLYNASLGEGKVHEE